MYKADYEKLKNPKDLLSSLYPLCSMGKLSEDTKVPQIDKILLTAVRQGASDIHLKVGYKPILRIGGMLQTLKTEILNAKDLTDIIKGLLSEQQQVAFSENGNLDTALECTDDNQQTHRYRVNVARDRGGPYIAIRVVPDKILSVEQIGFPLDVWQDIIYLKRGMVLVTGITGSGKTTTLASLINEINKRRSEHIITLEDPIEYVHEPIKSIISQRELGTTLSSFADGVMYALREDPDVLLIGEIRDRETAYKALEASATGHLVFSTLHTISAAETARRYVNIFEPEEQENIRNSLAANLAYVLCQQLIPYEKDVEKRVLAMEVMNVLNSPGIQHNLRKGDYHQIPSQLQTGRHQKMITMDMRLEQLCKEGKISKDNAIVYAHHPEEIRGKL